MTRVDGRVERGSRTRRPVLRRTVDIASVEGLEALTVGRLAAEPELSRSGVFALFGSKQELQPATRAGGGADLHRAGPPARRRCPARHRPGVAAVRAVAGVLTEPGVPGLLLRPGA